MSDRAQRMGLRTGDDTEAGTVLDTWYPAPELGAPGDAGRRRGRRAGRAGRALEGRTRPAASGAAVVRTVDRPRRRRRPTPPTPTCACTCSRTAWCRRNSHQPRRHLRRARQRRVDQRRPLRRRGVRAHPPAPAASTAAVQVLRRRQVPPDDRLRGARPACGSPTPTGCGSAPTSPPGTTVMHEGFVNFNAGTLGTSMVEGRIVAGRRRR